MVGQGDKNKSDFSDFFAVLTPFICVMKGTDTNFQFILSKSLQNLHEEHGGRVPSNKNAAFM